LLIVSHTFPSLILSKGKEEDDTSHDAKDVNAAAGENNNDKEVNDGTSMPPRGEAHGRSSNEDCREKNKEGR
jgi:hypothetical protein